MKNLIKKILREQVEEDLGGVPQVEDNAMRRIRVVLDLMKRYGKKWDGYLDGIAKTKKEPYGYEGMKDILNNLLKIVGGGKDSRYGGDFDKTYWFSKVFQINGGENRNFREGEIQLIELPQYEMEANYSEEATDYRTGWGSVVGVTSEDEAVELFTDDFGSYLEDSESNDMDYGDVYDVEDVTVITVEWIRFMPKWVGL
tara:strand:+ start:727 stop:1323 length:597 start_codon:yes stop_codon:yes gene_type:complete